MAEPTDEKDIQYLRIKDIVSDRLDKLVSSGDMGYVDLIDRASSLAERSPSVVVGEYEKSSEYELHLPLDQAELNHAEKQALQQALASQRHVLGDHMVASICFKNQVNPPVETLRGWASREWADAKSNAIKVRQIQERIAEAIIEEELPEVFAGLGNPNGVLNVIQKFKDHDSHDGSLRLFIESLIIEQANLASSTRLRKRVENILYDKITDTQWKTNHEMFFAKNDIQIDLPRLQDRIINGPVSHNLTVDLLSALLERLSDTPESHFPPDWLRWPDLLERAISINHPAPLMEAMRLASAHPESLLPPDLMSELEQHVSSIDKLAAQGRWPSYRSGLPVRKDEVERWMSETRERFVANEQAGEMLREEPELIADPAASRSPSP